jgi:hypothetical protein
VVLQERRARRPAWKISATHGCDWGWAEGYGDQVNWVQSLNPRFGI